MNQTFKIFLKSKDHFLKINEEETIVRTLQNCLQESELYVSQPESFSESLMTQQT